MKLFIKFIKGSVLNSAPNIVLIDIAKNENLKDFKDMDLGFAIKNTLRHAGIKLVHEMLCRKQCRDLLIEFCHWLIKKSLLQYPLTKGISCFDPAIALKFQVQSLRLTKMLDYFVEHKWLSGSQGDRIWKNFSSCCQTLLFENKMKNFSIQRYRLDDYWLHVILSHSDFSELHRRR